MDKIASMDFDSSRNHHANIMNHNGLKQHTQMEGNMRQSMNDYENTNKKGEMQVKKRNGEYQDMSFDKILMRVKNLGKQAKIESLNYSALVVKIIDQLYDGIETKLIDELTAEQCATTNAQNPAFGTLAGYVSISNHQKNTSSSFSKVVKELYHNYTNHTNEHKPLLSKDMYDYVMKHSIALEQMIDYERDFLIEYFGFKTLEKSYLMKKQNVIQERVQHMWMRVAVALHMNTNPSNIQKDLNSIEETYNLLSKKYFIHATPTLYNAGTKHQQLSSCYLIANEEDSIEGIYST